jgi:hypothetical protein
MFYIITPNVTFNVLHLFHFWHTNPITNVRIFRIYHLTLLNLSKIKHFAFGTFGKSNPLITNVDQNNEEALHTYI